MICQWWSARGYRNLQTPHHYHCDQQDNASSLQVQAKSYQGHLAIQRTHHDYNVISFNAFSSSYLWRLISRSSWRKTVCVRVTKDHNQWVHPHFWSFDVIHEFLQRVRLISFWECIFDLSVHFSAPPPISLAYNRCQNSLGKYQSRPFIGWQMATFGEKNVTSLFCMWENPLYTQYRTVYSSTQFRFWEKCIWLIDRSKLISTKICFPENVKNLGNTRPFQGSGGVRRGLSSKFWWDAL